MPRSHSKPLSPTEQVMRQLHGEPTPADWINATGSNLEVAREALLAAAKKADAGNLPTMFHRDLLFAMDQVRELEQTLAEFMGAVR